MVIPVKDGAGHLAEVLAAVRGQDGEAELLVIDSGSRDGSQDLARAAGARLHEIPSAAFGHGRTRNLGAELAEGDVIAFLTQDATPLPGWRDALLEPFAQLDVGVVFGAQHARPGAPPMVARELEWFFEHVEDEDPAYLSNVNAAYRRGCWAEVGFRDVPYAEDQAFARDLAGTRWRKAYAREAAVLHSHHYGAVAFWRRAFDEARGLRETTGRVERITARGTAAGILRQVRRDARWMSRQGWPAHRRAGWLPRSLAAHTGRKAFAWLGSRSERLPRAARRLLSLEGRD